MRVGYVLSDDDKQIFDVLAGEILGLDKDTAQKSLINHPYVSEAKVKILPFWRKKVVENTDHIDFEIEE